MKFREKKIEWLYKGFFEFKKLIVEFETFEGDYKEANVEYFHRGDSCCILLNQSETKELLSPRSSKLVASMHYDYYII